MMSLGRLVPPGLAMIAVTYGLARFAYGLFLPDMREAFDLPSALLGTIGALSYVGYCAAIVVSLAFTSPTLGRLDLRLELRGDRLLAEVTTPAGRPHAIAAEGSERLRAKLEESGLEATVNVRPRHTSLDLYA